MDHIESLVEDSATDAAVETENQVEQETKTYTQKEVDDMMARMKSSLQRKLTKPYEELGPVDELRRLKQEAEQRQQEESLKRGEFEKVLQDLASKKDSEIQKRDQVIREYKINTPLISAAAASRAINAEQVKTLLAPNVRLNDSGDVEVVDSKGAVRYDDNGSPLTVDQLVNEFLTANPHFVAPTPSTTHTKSSHNTAKGEVDLSKLDMTNPEHRKLYAEKRQKVGIMR